MRGVASSSRCRSILGRSMRSMLDRVVNIISSVSDQPASDGAAICPRTRKGKRGFCPIRPHKRNVKMF